MTDNKTPAHDYAADALAALEKLRAYAAGRSDDIMGAIDRLGDFVDARTQGKYADTIDKAQATAKQRIGSTLGKATSAPAHVDPEPADPFSLDDEPTWKQPPASGAHAYADPAGKPLPKPDLKAAVAKLRTFAAEHTDDLTGLVDKVGDFVDRQTQGRYADRIDKAQTAAKTQIGKLT